MNAAKNVPAVLFAFALTLLSLPWILWATGYMVRGDDDAATRVLERSPLGRWLDYVEGPL